MKSLNLTILLVSLVALIGCNKPKGELHYMNLYSTTITLLKCENLKKSSQLRNLILSDKENDALLDVFSKLQPINNNLDIDARMYGIIYKGSEKLNFCMSTTIIEINNEKYFVDDQLREYMLMLTTQKK